MPPKDQKSAWSSNPKIMFKGIVNSVKSLANSGAATPAKGITKDTLFEPIPEDCDHDCDSCTIKLPANFKIEEDEDLWQTAKGWSTHIVVATGKTDWVRDVSDEKETIMEALSKSDKALQPTNGKLMVSASNMPLPPSHDKSSSKPTTVLLLPSFTMIDDVSPKDAVELVTKFINTAPTTTTPLNATTASKLMQSDGTEDLAAGVTRELVHEGVIKEGEDTAQEGGVDALPTVVQSKSNEAPAHPPPTADLAALSLASPIESYLKSRPCPHDYIILLCSHKHRDARCGQSAPLILKELRRQLSPLGLYRDLDDSRSGGVGIYFINHVGGHKWSANMMVYRKKAGQGIWLARVGPKDIEKIVKWTVLEGKVSADMIRAGFDRGKGITSW